MQILWDCNSSNGTRCRIEKDHSVYGLGYLLRTLNVPRHMRGSISIEVVLNI